MEKVNYFLVLEKRLGDYNIVDINRLDICNSYVTNDLSSIDSFTCKYKEDEIRASIIRCNISHPDYLNCNLKIVSDMKHNLRILTKDMFMIVREFQVNNVEFDRDLKNKVFGIYKKIIESTFKDISFKEGMLDRFKLSLKSNDKKEVFSIIEELPYNKIRNIYICIYEEIERKKLESLRKLEKLDDAS